MTRIARLLAAGLLVCVGLAEAQVFAPFVGLNSGITARVFLSGHMVTSSAAGAQTATLTLLNTGVLRETTTSGGNVDFASEWLNPNGTAEVTLYEALATVTVGTLTSGTTGSWVSLASNQSWSLQDITAGDGPETATFTLDIRYAPTGQVMGTGTIVLTAERS